MDLNSHPEDEIEMLPKLVEKHGPNSSPPVMSFTPEEEHIILLAQAYYGDDEWVAIAQSLIGRTYDVILNHWNSTLKGTNEDITIHGYNRMPTLKSLFPLSGHERPQQELNKIDVLDKQKIYTTAATEPLWNLNTIGTQGHSGFRLVMETGSQNSIHQGNSSHEVRGMVSGQAPSISDMARGNMSSGGTHSYSRDHSAPSWNALYKRDPSPMMIDSDSVQQFVGSEFGWNDFSEDSSKA